MPAARPLGALLVALATLALGLSGCLFSPSIEPEDCALQCSHDECPAGYGCKEVDEGVGYCVELSSTRTCRASAKQSELPPGTDSGAPATPWFGFVDAALGPRRLQLVDPQADAEAGLQLPDTLDEAESVRDFRFSPDGRWLAVRIDAGERRRLSVFEAPLWTPLGSTDASVSVDEYAWAPNGALLAFAGARDGAAFLCALRVLEAGAAHDGSRLLLQPESPAPQGSPLLWFGERAIAFHSGEGQLGQSRLVYGGPFGGDGFAVSAFLGASYGHSPDAPVALVAGSGGFFALAPAGKDTAIDHYRLLAGSLARTVHRPNLLLSPDAVYLAHAEQGRLRIYAADEARRDPLEGYPLALLEGDGCQVLLAWSHESDWLACATDGLPGPGLRLFRIGVPVAQPAPAGVDGATAWRAVGLTAFDVEGSELYSAALAQRRRRGFSPGGRWFSFSTDHALYAVDLHEPRLQLRQAPARFESVLVSSDFIPSPDGQWLVTHQGSWLSRHALASLSQASALTSAQLEPALPCREGQTSASTGSCGSGSTRSEHVAWSPDSRALVFRSTESELHLLRLLPSEREVRLSVACDRDCFRTSAFQPTLPLPRE